MYNSIIIIVINILCLLLFVRDINEGHLSLENSDDDQSNFAAKLKSLDEGKNTIEKWFLKK